MHVRKSIHPPPKKKHSLMHDFECAFFWLCIIIHVNTLRNNTLIMLIIIGVSFGDPSHHCHHMGYETKLWQDQTYVAGPGVVEGGCQPVLACRCF